MATKSTSGSRVPGGQQAGKEDSSHVGGDAAELRSMMGSLDEEADELAARILSPGNAKLVAARQALTTAVAERVQLSPEVIHRMANEGVLGMWLQQLGIEPPAASPVQPFERAGERIPADPYDIVQSDD
jgi:hypothetical protein